MIIGLRVLLMALILIGGRQGKSQNCWQIRGDPFHAEFSYFDLRSSPLNRCAGSFSGILAT
jgi:hypothetical protein